MGGVAGGLVGGGVAGGLVGGGLVGGGFVGDGLVADGSLVGRFVVVVDLTVGVSFAPAVVGTTGATVVSGGGGGVDVVVLEEANGSEGTRRAGTVVGVGAGPVTTDVARSVPANRTNAMIPESPKPTRVPAAVSVRLAGGSSAHRPRRSPPGIRRPPRLDRL